MYTVHGGHYFDYIMNVIAHVYVYNASGCLWKKQKGVQKIIVNGFSGDMGLDGNGTVVCGRLMCIRNARKEMNVTF